MKCIPTPSSLSAGTDATCANHFAVGAGSGLVSTTGTCTGIDVTSLSWRPTSLRAGRTSILASTISCSILSGRWALSAR